MRSEPFRARLRAYSDAVREAEATRGDPDALFERNQAREADAMSRRTFLTRGAAFGLAFAGTGALVSGPFARRADAVAPQIAVVGGGLAGTTAAYRINRLRGWVPEIYEARDRIGGRTRTFAIGSGQYAEAGGGGINTRDTSIQDLAQEIGLWPLVDTWKNYPGGGEIYHFNGSEVTWASVKDAIADNNRVLWQAWTEIGRKIPTYKNANAAMRRYDGMTARQFLNSRCPHGTDTLAGELMATWFGVENGGAASEASALHLILGEAGIWGAGWDERYAIPGGNEELSKTLAGALPPEAVHLEHALVAIVENPNGSFTLTFDDGGSLVDVVADEVVLALPPTALADVDFSAAGISRVHRRQIRLEKLGHNAKYNLQFSSKPWAAAGDAGDGASDNGMGEFWQANFLANNPALLIGMNNEDYGAHPAHGQASTTVRNSLLASIDQIWPGASSQFVDGQAWLDYWPNDPWAKGSYAYYPPDGFTTFGGVQAEPAGGIHFAGEHTARYIERGYMNGAVASGERVAREIA